MHIQKYSLPCGTCKQYNHSCMITWSSMPLKYCAQHHEIFKICPPIRQLDLAHSYLLDVWHDSEQQKWCFCAYPTEIPRMSRLQLGCIILHHPWRITFSPDILIWRKGWQILVPSNILAPPRNIKATTQSLTVADMSGIYDGAGITSWEAHIKTAYLQWSMQ